MVVSYMTADHSLALGPSEEGTHQLTFIYMFNSNKTIEKRPDYRLFSKTPRYCPFLCLLRYFFMLVRTLAYLLLIKFDACLDLSGLLLIKFSLTPWSVSYWYSSSFGRV